MSTTETRPSDYIPSDSEVKAGNGNKAWHFAYGKIARGKRNPIDNSYPETRSKIVGRIQRVGVFSGTDKDTGRAYSQLELDIRTASGNEYVKCSLCDNDGNLRPSISTLGLAYALTQCEPNELIEIVAILGSKPVKLPNGTDGGYPTYVNVGKIDATNTSNPIYRPKLADGAPKLSAIEQWNSILPQLKAKGYYKERVAKASASNSHIDALNAEMAAKGWPTIPEFPEGWHKVLLQVKMSPTDAKAVIDRALGFGDSLSEDAEHGIGQLRLGLKNRTEIPAALKRAEAPKEAPKVAPAPSTGGLDLDALASEYDPFADE